MKKILLILLFHLFLTTNIKAQWKRQYGGPFWDHGKYAIQTKNGDFIMVGYSESFRDSGQILMIRTNHLGETIWRKAFGKSQDYNKYDIAHSVTQSADGNFIVKWTTFDTLNRNILNLTKININGNIIWNKQFDLEDNNYIGLFGPGTKLILENSDGTLIIAGRTKRITEKHDEIYLLKTDSLGNKIWISFFGENAIDQTSSVINDSNGDFLIVGMMIGNSYIIKVDTTGKKIWEKSYNRQSRVSSALITKKGNILLAGRSVNSGNYAGFLMLISPFGDSIWCKEYQDSFYNFTSFNSLTEAQDSTYYVTARPMGIWHIDSKGNLLTYLCLEEGQSVEDEGCNIFINNVNKHVVIFGSTLGFGGARRNDYFDFCLVESDLNDCNLKIIKEPEDISCFGGEVLFKCSANDSSVRFQWQTFVDNIWVDLSDKGIYSNTKTNILTIKNVTNKNDNQLFRCMIYDTCGRDTTRSVKLNIWGANVDELNYLGLTIQPNPVKNALIFGKKLMHQYPYEIYSISGNLVQKGLTSEIINVNEIQGGLYILKIQNVTLKFIKE